MESWRQFWESEEESWQVNSTFLTRDGERIFYVLVELNEPIHDFQPLLSQILSVLTPPTQRQQVQRVFLQTVGMPGDCEPILDRLVKLLSGQLSVTGYAFDRERTAPCQRWWSITGTHERN